MLHSRSCPSWAARLIMLAMAGLAGCNASFPTAPAADNAGNVPAASSTMPFQLSGLLDSLGSLVGTQSSELRRLVESGDLEQARAFYAANQASLDESSLAEPSITRLAQLLNGRDAPRQRELAARLAKLDKAGLTQEDWPAAGAAVREAQAELQARAQDPLLRQPAHSSPEAAALQARLDAARQMLENAAPEQLGGYLAGTPVSPQDFFERYPITFDNAQRRQLLETQSAVLAEAVQRLGSGRGAALLEGYMAAGAVDPATADKLLQAWHSAYAREQGWPPGQLSRERKLESARQLKASVPAWNRPVLRTVVVPLVDSKLNPARQEAALDAVGKMAAHWSAQVQPPSQLASAAQRLREWHADEVDLVVLVELGRVSGIEAPAGASKQQARYLARHESKANPAHRELQQQLAQAELAWRQAEQAEKQAQQQAKSIASQSRSAFGALAVIGLVSSSVANSTVQKSRVEELNRDLARTPATVSTPVYQPYERTAVTHRLLVAAPAAVYLYDPASQTISAFDLTSSRTQDVVTFEGIHPSDPEAKTLAAPQPAGQRIGAMGLQLLAQLPEQAPDLDQFPGSGPGTAADADLLEHAAQARQRQRQWMEQQVQRLAQQ